MHSSAWSPAFQGLPDVFCSECGNGQGPAQCWLGFASLALCGRHPMPHSQWSGRILPSRRSWGGIDKLVKYSSKRRDKLLAGTICSKWRASYLLGSVKCCLLYQLRTWPAGCTTVCCEAARESSLSQLYMAGLGQPSVPQQVCSGLADSSTQHCSLQTGCMACCQASKGCQLRSAENSSENENE